MDDAIRAFKAPVATYDGFVSTINKFVSESNRRAMSFQVPVQISGQRLLSSGELAKIGYITGVPNTTYYISEAVSVAKVLVVKITPSMRRRRKSSPLHVMSLRNLFTKTDFWQRSISSELRCIDPASWKILLP